MDTLGVINSLFGVPRALVGVVHTGGLPGTPVGNQSIDQIVETAVAEARVYASAGYSAADALIVGSSIKHGGVWSGAIDQSRARELARAFGQS